MSQEHGKGVKKTRSGSLGEVDPHKTRSNSGNRKKETKGSNNIGKETCLVCANNCSPINSLECDLCHRWYHPTCQNIEPEMFRLLKKDSESASPLITWYCFPICKSLSTDLLDGMLKVKQDIQKISEDVSSVKNKMNDIEEGKFTPQMQEAIRSIVDEKTENTGGPEPQAQVNQNDLLKLVEEKNQEHGKEFQEQVRRSKNLIVFGIPEPESKRRQERINKDNENARKIVQEVNCTNEPIETRRLGKYNNTKTRPLKVMFRSQVDRDEVLSAVIKLRKNKKEEDKDKLCIKAKGINRDMTPKEQKEDEKLFKEWIEKKELSKNEGDDHAIWIRKNSKVVNIGKYPDDEETVTGEEEEDSEEEQEEMD